MNNLQLHPLAAHLRWRFPVALPVEDWHLLLQNYLSVLAKDCQAAGSVVIGHIKGLMLLPDGGFLRASAVSADHPVDTEIRASTDNTFQELMLTVNVIVYGLPFDAAKKIVLENAQIVIEARRGSLVIESITEEGSHHGHNHD